MKVEPISQSIGAVVELLTFLGRQTDPLPQSIKIRGAVLVLNAKKDVYYVVTPKACSCPAYTYHPDKLCKHQRKYFQDSLTAKARTDEDKVDTLKPIANWPNGCHGPYFD